MSLHYRLSIGAGRARGRLGAGAVAALAASVALGAAGPALAQGAATSAYPRAETLYTGGGQWGNIVGFNPYVGNYAVGTVGLVNETLFRYDPLKDVYIPWLASDGKWTSDNVYILTIRDGVTWSDGTPFTADDVKWNIDLGQFATIPWHNLYTGMKSVEASGNTVTITFDGTPKYQEWQNQVWNIPMIQPAQWKDHANADEITSWSPDDPVGTGPYVLDKSGYDPTTRVVWKKKDNWWAAEAGVSPSPKPNYIIDLVNSSNNVALSLVLGGQEDLNNNYLPGITRLLGAGYGLATYYSEPPYMLSANTAWLVPNLKEEPLSDVKFRRALAEAIDVDQIVNVDYGNLVLPANPTGLLPNWDKYVDKDAVAKYGWSFDTDKAKKDLEAAGYKMGSDGYFTQPDGTPIDLTIAVPAGWSDWMQAIQMISADAKKVGIKITPAFPDFNTWQSNRNTGKFDLVIDNTAQISDTPFTYYQYLFNLPVLDSQTTYNFSRVEDKKAWDLVQQLDSTKPTDTDGMKQIISQLQTISMQELPAIPLWYNGIWAQATTANWTNWPSADSDRNYLPAMWRGYLQMTGIDTITHLEPAAQQ